MGVLLLHTAFRTNIKYSFPVEYSAARSTTRATAQTAIEEVLMFVPMSLNSKPS